MADNLNTVWTHGKLLAIRCRACDHRAVLGKDKAPIRRANMTRLRDLKLRCASCGVAGQAPDRFEFRMPADQEEAKQFLSGYDIGLAPEV